MPLFEVTSSGLQRRPTADFTSLEIYERRDLQRHLRENISALGEDLLIIAEEFGNWEDARRRIDLLAIDRRGQLVVIEVKRTDDGGHMELQAIRYAAMISSMSYEDVLAAYTRHCATYRAGEEIDPAADLETFLGTSETDEEPTISTNVRIILVSADFGREITTAVLWLNGFEGMDLRCVRLVPYDIDGRVFLDIQQLIPLPETADYQVRIRQKGAARERARAGNRELVQYHVVVDGEELPAQNKRNTMRVMVGELLRRGVSAMDLAALLPPSKLRILAGNISPGEDVRTALVREQSGIDLRRWFVDHPFFDEKGDLTLVLSNQWGRQTEAKLSALVEEFTDAKVTFRRVGADD